MVSMSWRLSLSPNRGVWCSNKAAARRARGPRAAIAHWTFLFFVVCVDYESFETGHDVGRGIKPEKPPLFGEEMGGGGAPPLPAPRARP